MKKLFPHHVSVSLLVHCCNSLRRPGSSWFSPLLNGRRAYKQTYYLGKYFDKLPCYLENSPRKYQKLI